MDDNCKSGTASELTVDLLLLLPDESAWRGEGVARDIGILAIPEDHNKLRHETNTLYFDQSEARSHPVDQ